MEAVTCSVFTYLLSQFLITLNCFYIILVVQINAILVLVLVQCAWKSIIFFLTFVHVHENITASQ